jgi:hypothetical protein
MRSAVALALVLALVPPLWSQELAEPRSGARFPLTNDGQALLGLGLRVKKVAFVKVNVYAVALYVSDAVLEGPLSAYRGHPASPELFRELVWGDFEKRLVLRFLRDLEREQIVGAMRGALTGRSDARLLEQFVSYFTELKEGEECELRWLPGGSLEVSLAGRRRPPIEGKDFAAAVFGIYLGDRPLQEDIKRGLASRLTSSQ